MSDPVLALVLLVVFVFAIAAVRFFKTLDAGFWRAARNPMIAGLVAGIIIMFIEESVRRWAVIGVVLTIAALYVRLTGEESEPADGMLLGSLTGAAAALPLVLRGYNECRNLSECLLAGAVAGYGITFGLTHVRDRMRQVAVDAITAVVAAFAAWAPTLIHRFGAQDQDIAIASATLIPLIGIATVFGQWSDVRAELSHEASMGFIADTDVRRTAHPLLRLGSGGWSDTRAHREFVRLANQVALRKRQQRNRPEEVARLYQLEIIKLRMQMQQMSDIDRAARAHRKPEVRSDTMPRKYGKA
jgi:hypothetical protein